MSAEQKTAVGNDAIIPYMIPAYWDGVELGSPATDPVLNTSSDPDRYRAGRLLAAHLTTAGVKHAFETLHDKQSFEVADYPLGTITLLRNEYLTRDLRGGNVELNFDEEPVLSAEPGNRISAVYESLGRGQTGFSGIESPPLRYATYCAWGVVLANRKGTPIMQLIPTQNVTRTGRRVRISEYHDACYQQLTIGKVEHSQSKRQELLSRINYLEIVGFGTSRRARAERIASHIFMPASTRN